jgi:hypothetical protein
MTLIACFQAADSPIVFGDLLISANERHTHAVPLPAVRDASGVNVDNLHVAGLAQKLVIISKDCVLAWAGDMETAGAVIAELRERFRTGPPLTHEQIIETWQNWRSMKVFPASMVGAAWDGCEWYMFHHGATLVQGKVLGTMFAAGSGTHALIELDQRLAGVDIASSSPDVTLHQRAQALAAILSGFIMQDEVREGEQAPTLRRLFGGAYEAVLYGPDGFYKLDNYATLMWSAHVVDGKVRSIEPKFVLKQQYANDHLLLQSAKLRIEHDRGVLFDVQQLTVPPMYPVTVAPTFGSVSFDTNAVCHCVVITEDGENIAEILTRLEVQNTAHDLRQHNHDGKLFFELQPGLIERAIGWIEES